MKKKISAFIGMLFYKISILIERCKSQYLLSQIKHGGMCHIGAKCDITHPQNIILGSNVSIGNNCLFMNAKAKIIMGNHIMLAPKVSIVTGNHRVDKIGAYMDMVIEKSEDYDQDVIIEDDVWIGMNVTILKGVTIGKGSVIGAGSIITHNVPQYSIYYPEATVCKKKRFSDKNIAVHEKILNEKKGVIL